MIAYLQGKDVTVEVPDDIGDKDLSDLNQHFDTLVKPETPEPAANSAPTTTGSGDVPNGPEAATPKPTWTPNFYESFIKPILPGLTLPGTASLLTSENRALVGKATEEMTFGLSKPLTDAAFGADYKQHPVWANAGAMAGGVGSLLAAGGALKAAGLGVAAEEAFAPVAKTIAAAPRFLPQAIMTGATFGTQTFIKETVKAFQEGNVDLAAFGGHVLKNTALGLTLGGISKLSNVPTAIASAAGLGFVSSKMDGGDNAEATLNGGIWAIFEAVGSYGRTAELRSEALKTLGDSIGEYVQNKDPNIAPEQAKAAGEAIVRQAAERVGGLDAVVKGEKGETLQLIEDINQQVRQGKIQEPVEPQKLLEGPAAAEEPAKPTPEMPLAPVPGEKPVNLDDQGIPKLRPKAVVATVEDPDGKPVKITHEMVLEEAKGLKESEKQNFQQANPLAQFVLDNGGVRGFKGGMESEEFKDVPLRFRGSKALDEMAQEAYNAGLLDEPNADLLRVELASVGKRAEPKPMAVLYEQAKQNLSSFFSSTLPGEIPTQLEPGVAFSRAPGSSGDLINTQSENVADRYERVRQQALAQGMNPAQASAHAKNVLRGKPATAPEAAAPKPKQGEFGAEGGVQGFGQGRQGEGELNFSRSPGAKAEEPPVIKQVADHFKESATEIRDIVAPGKAAPLAERITRENLGKMARSYDMAEASLEEAGKLFDRQPKEVNLAFIDKMEHGQKQDDPQFEVIAKTLRNLLDSKRKEIQALGTGKLSAFIENYFPHIWDQGEKGVSQAIQKAAKRPLEGGKSFLKKRKIEFTNDGIEMGLTPVSFNPVDLTLLKIREMDKYLMAHKTLKEFKDTGLAKYVKIGGEVPEGWTKIDDKVSTVFKSPMIAVQEAYDEEMVNRLNLVATSLGVELNRKTSLGRHKGMPAGVWGYSESQTPGQPGKVTTKFGGPESVIAHELGHQLDNIYGMQSRFLGAESEAEFSKLASLREGENADQDFKKYIQKPEERMAVMLESYIHAPQLFKENAPTLFKKFETFLDSRPELRPLTEIKPSLVMGQNESEVYAGGAVIAGHIWAQPDAAKIINNYLSPGLQKSAIYRGYRSIGNFLNQAQLGFSFFHLGFTSVDAIVSKNALAAMELMNGNTKKAVLNLIRSPLSPIENIIRGDKLLQAWRGKGQSPVDEILAEAMASAGGRARMDQFYQTRAIEKMMENFKKFNFVRGALNIPMVLTELTTRPILEAIVPRQKLGVFSDLMKSELENRPEMTHDEMRGVAQRVWDSVDNRMGQLVYDNLFWNRTFKDLLMASVRSVGWNLGTLREIGGGAVDFAKAPLDIIKGEKPKFTYRMAYVVALTFTVGVASAIYQYLRTGKGPQEPKDYVFPRTGRTDRNGDPDRVALPSYMKDIYHYGKHPLQTVLNKTSPLLNMLVEMYQNKDYYGTKIRNEDDPLIRQMMSEVEFVGKQLLPFSLRGTQQNLSAGNRSLADVIGPWIGVTPAPASINQTPAEELAHEIASSHVEIGGRTKDQVERAKMLSDLRRRFSSGDQSTMNDLTEAINKRQLSRAEALDVLKESKMTPLQRMAHSFSYDELQRVYKKGNEEEKAQLEPLLRQREISNIRQFGAATGRAPLP